jgi:hypothetical protein
MTIGHRLKNMTGSRPQGKSLPSLLQVQEHSLSKTGGEPRDRREL